MGFRRLLITMWEWGLGEGLLIRFLGGLVVKVCVLLFCLNRDSWI
jgi:hypothetical protein